jgi:hypothetical protein
MLCPSMVTQETRDKEKASRVLYILRGEIFVVQKKEKNFLLSFLSPGQQKKQEKKTKQVRRKYSYSSDELM